MQQSCAEGGLGKKVGGERRRGGWRDIAVRRSQVGTNKCLRRLKQATVLDARAFLLAREIQIREQLSARFTFRHPDTERSTCSTVCCRKIPCV